MKSVLITLRPFNVNARHCGGDVPQGQLSIGGNGVIAFTKLSPVGGANSHTLIGVPFTELLESPDAHARTC